MADDPILAVLVRIESKIESVDNTLRGVQISYAAKHAEHETKITTIGKDINGIGDKIRTHIERHWQWIASVVGIVGAIVATAKFMGN